MADAKLSTDFFSTLARSYSPWSWLAPIDLSQPINPGWAFGNIIINENNSSAPGTEQAILAQESYGRQIGKLLDAVYALTKDRPDRNDESFRDIADLKKKVDEIKSAAATARIEQFMRDLQLLKSTNAAEFKKRISDVRALLAKM